MESDDLNARSNGHLLKFVVTKVSWPSSSLVHDTVLAKQRLLFITNKFQIL
jgi:hypothetical protein